MMRKSKALAKSIAARSARSDARYRQLRDLSEQGASKEQAAKAVGMTVNGIKSLLEKKVGSQAWPIKSDAILALQSPPAKVG